MPPRSASPLPSLTAANVVIVAGKGGVGKTTVTAAIARGSARLGRRVLVVELDGKPTLETLLPPAEGQSIEVVHLSAPDALDEYLREHGFARIAKRLNRTGVIDVVGTAAPGIDDIVVLGKVKQLERSGAYDLIVVDGPAAGHAVTFLMAAAGLSDAVRGGPVRAQADEVLELLGDGERCQAVLVTLPETTPVNEAIETAYALEEKVGIRLGPIVVNAVDEGGPLPGRADVDAALDAALDTALGAVTATDVEVLREAARFRSSRREMESEVLDRLSRDLPLDQVHLPALPVAGLTAADVDRLAEILVDGHEGPDRPGGSDGRPDVRSDAAEPSASATGDGAS